MSYVTTAGRVINASKSFSQKETSNCIWIRSIAMNSRRKLNRIQRRRSKLNKGIEARLF